MTVFQSKKNEVFIRLKSTEPGPPAYEPWSLAASLHVPAPQLPQLEDQHHTPLVRVLQFEIRCITSLS